MVCRLPGSSVPPLAFGTMWSAVSGLSGDPVWPHAEQNGCALITAAEALNQRLSYPRCVLVPRRASIRAWCTLSQVRQRLPFRVGRLHDKQGLAGRTGTNASAIAYPVRSQMVLIRAPAPAAGA